MLAFESLTPEALLKEVAEYIRMAALRRAVEVTILDRKSRLTRAEKEKRARDESADNALRLIAQELDDAAIIPANSILRRKTDITLGDVIADQFQIAHDAGECADDCALCNEKRAE